MKKIRILSLDGGGIRGILPGTVLTYIEQRLQEKTGNKNAKIADFFELVAGTSTGGILACISLVPDNNGKPKYGAADALDIYLKKGHRIFDRSLRQRISSLGGIRDEKYDATALEEELLDYFGDLTLNDLIKPCLISSYDIRRRQARFFTSTDAHQPVRNFYVRDVCRATSAAPTYFEVSYIKNLLGTPFPLIDGGIFVNNPTLCAYAEARCSDFKTIFNDENYPTHPSAKDMMILSIGTGTQLEEYRYDDFKDAGMIQWIKPLIDMMMSGNSETVDFQLKRIYDTVEGPHKNDYFRIDPVLHNADTAMDDASPKNIKALHDAGLVTIEKYADQIETIVDRIIANN